ncbi:hypothetical protein AAON49_08270 [Pseudotenacibaculum sp. MALMAid0570]|uniref:hypothetical protein n=1 Tax=Pseudotenacibaculum sp. MALMAid0570 TaxID=3143938 RepID=UPI0032DE58B1
MKNIRTIIPILLLFLCANTFAQKKRIKRPDQDKIRQYKIAYITDQLNFNEKEAEKFWPVYNAHEKQISELRKQERSKFWKLIKNKEEITNLSESDSKIMVVAFNEIQDKIQTINKEYFKKLKNILPYKKILKLKIAEISFKRHLFDKLKKQRRIKDKRE